MDENLPSFNNPDKPAVSNQNDRKLSTMVERDESAASSSGHLLTYPEFEIVQKPAAATYAQGFPNQGSIQNI